MEILIKILKDLENRTSLIREFQEYIWNENPQFKNIEEENILRDLAYDLEFYLPENKSKVISGYYGDDRLEKEIITALRKLGID